MTRYILVNKPARPTVGARGVRCRRARALLERYCTVSFETIVATFHLPLSLEYPPAQHSCRGQCCGRWRMTSCSCPQKLGRICRLCAKTRPSSASFNQKLSCQHATMRLFYGSGSCWPSNTSRCCHHSSRSRRHPRRGCSPRLYRKNSNLPTRDRWARCPSHIPPQPSALQLHCLTCRCRQRLYLASQVAKRQAGPIQAGRQAHLLDWPSLKPRRE